MRFDRILVRLSGCISCLLARECLTTEWDPLEPERVDALRNQHSLANAQWSNARTRENVYQEKEISLVQSTKYKQFSKFTRVYLSYLW